MGCVGWVYVRVEEGKYGRLSTVLSRDTEVVRTFSMVQSHFELCVGTRQFTQQLYAFDAGSGTTRAIRPLSMPLSYESLRVGGRLFFTGGVLAAPTLILY